MEQLIEDYGRRLKTVIEEIAKGGNDLTINRLGTKASNGNDAFTTNIMVRADIQSVA